MPVIVDHLNNPHPLSTIHRMFLLKLLRQRLYGSWEHSYLQQALPFLQRNNKLQKRHYKGFRFQDVEISPEEQCPAFAPLHASLAAEFLPLFHNMEQDYLSEARQVMPYLVRLITCCTWQEELYLAIPAELRDVIPEVVPEAVPLSVQYLQPVNGEYNHFTEQYWRVQHAFAQVYPLIKQRMVLNVLFNQI